MANDTKDASPAKPAATQKEYTPEQKAAAEQKVVDDNAAAVKKRGELVDKTVENLMKEFDGMDHAGRSSALEEISHRILSVKTVAANAQVRTSPAAVRAEEIATMPRQTPSVATGEAPNRNIMMQGDQNETETLS